MQSDRRESAQNEECFSYIAISADESTQNAARQGKIFVEVEMGGLTLSISCDLSQLRLARVHIQLRVYFFNRLALVKILQRSLHEKSENKSEGRKKKDGKTTSKRGRMDSFVSLFPPLSARMQIRLDTPSLSPPLYSTLFFWPEKPK